jgi:hypothetical protein
LDVTYETPSLVGRMLLQKRVSKGLKAFMADLEAASAAVSLEAPSLAKRKGKLSRTSVLLVSHD